MYIIRGYSNNREDLQSTNPMIDAIDIPKISPAAPPMSDKNRAYLKI